jgi:hypothetical protein
MAKRTRFDTTTCACPVIRHEHGTLAFYNKHACGCDPCRDAHAERARVQRRRKAYGTYQTLAIPNLAARRRVQALMTQGWSMRFLSSSLDMSGERLGIILRTQAGISRAKDAAITALDDELWDKCPSERTKGERIAARRTRAFAQRRGYASPLCWDDDTITDPDALPDRGDPDADVFDTVAVDYLVGGRRDIALTKPERHEAIRRLHEIGLTDSEIGRRIGMHHDAVTNTRLRHGIRRAAAA